MPPCGLQRRYSAKVMMATRGRVGAWRAVFGRYPVPAYPPSDMLLFILMRGPQRAPLGVSAERYRLYAIRRTYVWRASAQIRWGVWLVGGHLGADPVGVGASAQIRWGVWLPYVVRGSMGAFFDDARS